MSAEDATPTEREREAERLMVESAVRVEELEGYLSRMADALQEDVDDVECLHILVAILIEAGFHA